MRNDDRRFTALLEGLTLDTDEMFITGLRPEFSDSIYRVCVRHGSGWMRIEYDAVCAPSTPQVGRHVRGRVRDIVGMRHDGSREASGRFFARVQELGAW